MKWIKPRFAVESMEAYQAPLEGRRNLLRLDFNENTLGPSPKVIEALKQIPSSHISIYPEYNGIKEALLENFSANRPSISISPNQIGIFNGVDASINAIFHAYGDQKELLLTTNPTFGYYSPCADMRGMETLAIPYEGDNFAFPLNKIKVCLKEKKPRILLICNPNNPTGTVISPQQIYALSELSPDTLIVVDELYEAFGGESLLPKINFDLSPNIVVLRSLSKTAGLAGLRIGFAIGNKNIINCISRVTGPYDVNTFAAVAAIASLKDQSYIDSYIEEVFSARYWLKEKLENEKIKHHINAGNYLLIWPKRDPKEMERCLKEDGILIRNMSNKHLIENSFRVSIGTQNQMQKFWESFIRHESID